VRVLITGGAGMLGGALAAAAPAGVEAHVTWRRTPAAAPRAHRVELARPGAFAALLERLAPRLVIHAAYGREEGERDIVDATRQVAEACAARRTELLHLSTDLVFDGERGPYAEEAAPAPVLDYGRWKVRAEEAVRGALPGAAILRPSLIASFTRPDPATAWVLAGLRGGGEVALYVDELRSPVRLDDLVSAIWEIAALAPGERAGEWHLGGDEALSRFALGLLIAGFHGLDAAPLVAAPSPGGPVRRPRDTRLLCRRTAALRVRLRGVSTLLTEPG
jgi:dTDP-4-dehydrorhamnose reductase